MAPIRSYYRYEVHIHTRSRYNAYFGFPMEPREEMEGRRGALGVHTGMGHGGIGKRMAVQLLEGEGKFV